MGILIHLYAAKEGWNDIADRYWDYKTQDLRCRHAEERFQDSVEDLRIAAREAVDYIEDDAKETIKAAQAAYQKIAECLDQVTQRQQEIKSSEDQWVAGGNLLLTAYREANREIRDAMSVPPYFDRFPTPADYRYKTYNGGPSDTEIDRFRDAVEHSLAEIRDLKQRAKEAETWSEEVLRSVSRLVTKSIKGIEERIDREVLNVKTPEFDGPSADFASYEDEPAGEAPGNATA